MTMWPRPSLTNALFAALGLFLASGQSAYAYIDPGTGSYVFQLVIGMGLAGGFLVKTYWRQLLDLFSRKNGGDEDEQ